MSRVNKHNHPQFKNNLSDFLFYGPALILFLIFVLFPILSSFGFAFTIWDGLTPPRWVGLYNFMEILHDNYVVIAVVNTLKYTIAYVLFDNLLALLIAIGLDRIRFWKSFWRGIYFLPVLIPGVITAITWKYLLNPVYGPINLTLSSIGLNSLALPWLQQPNLAIWVIVMVGIWQSVGSATVIYLAGIQSVPIELYEAAQIDGAGLFQQQRFITIPMIVPVIAINVVLSLIGALRVFDPIWLMTGGGPVGLTDVIATRVYKSAFEDQRFGYGSALSILLTAITLIAAILILKQLSKREVEQ
jgi:ABC-type sugar transport system permease subunit